MAPIRIVPTAPITDLGSRNGTTVNGDAVGIGTLLLGDGADPIPLVHRAGRWEVGGA